MRADFLTFSFFFISLTITRKAYIMPLTLSLESGEWDYGRDRSEPGHNRLRTLYIKR